MVQQQQGSAPVGPLVIDTQHEVRFEVAPSPLFGFGFIHATYYASTSMLFV